jgi:hypothetical protein
MNQTGQNVPVLMGYQKGPCQTSNNITAHLHLRKCIVPQLQSLHSAFVLNHQRMGKYEKIPVL